LPGAGSAAFAGVNKADLPGPATPPLASTSKTINPPLPGPSFSLPLRGGVAAIRRSRRNLWIALVLATLALLGAGALLSRHGASEIGASPDNGVSPDSAVLHSQTRK
jgi:hypothetical protein